MGRGTFTRDSYNAATTTFVPRSGAATTHALSEARRTGKLDPLVDPAGYGVIRRSLPRFEQLESGLYELTIGAPMPVETRLDTTGSMGGNVEVAIRVLPDAFDLCSQMLPGYDLQMATGIFGDAQDDFILCRPQFEMLAEKIVEQFTLMTPEHGGGGNGGEDPQYGLFGAAYLTDAYINRIGLKGYDFTVSDEPGRAYIDDHLLTRVFGDEVFDRLIENGYEIGRRNLPSTEDVVAKLLERAHAFFLQVGDASSTNRFWTNVFGPDRVIRLPDTKLLPQVQAVIIGLTEGTLVLDEVEAFLTAREVRKDDAVRITRSVANIPIGVQAKNDIHRPVKGDLFREKTDLWPIDPSDVPTNESSNTADNEEGPAWL